jgi:hypothetical protein
MKRGNPPTLQPIYVVKNTIILTHCQFLKKVKLSFPKGDEGGLEWGMKCG